MKTVYLSDYSHLIVDNDATAALSAALAECRKYSPVTLSLGGREWHFYKTNATRRTCYISNNDSGEKNIIFPLYGFSGLTVDGEGAALQFHGEVCPFVIDGSENLILKNFSIDYAHPYFLQATIVESTENSLVLELDPESIRARAEEDKIRFFLPDGEVEESFSDRFLVSEFDAETKAPSAYIPPYFLYLRKDGQSHFLSRMYRYVKGYTVSDTRICFEGEIKHKHNVGNKLIGTCGIGKKKRDCPAIFGNRSKDLVLNGVTLYASGAMGIICQVCENVTLRGVRTVANLERGRYLSVSADSTHFVNCLGDVVYENCVFTNMMDDASNVHGIYYKIDKVISEHEMILTYGHYQQVGVNVFDTGDRISIVNNRNFDSVKTLTVKSTEQISAEHLRLITEEELPEIEPDFVVEDLTKNPNLFVNGCVSGNNRPRGFLPATRGKIVITNSTFYNMDAALHFAGDCNSWYEAAAVEDVLVKGNKFKNSAYAGGVAILMDPCSLDKDRPYHRNITIIDNEFEMSSERFMRASLVENLVFKDNRFKKNESLPVHGKPSENGLCVTDCINGEIEEPKRI